MRQTGNPGWTDSSDWKLDQIVFARLNDLWGPLEVDLFARRLTNQLPSYVSWRPDPEAEATDALSGLASDLGLHIPPFSLVGRCLSQVQEQDTQYLCLVAPVWETPPWYPLLLHLSVEFPRLFPTDPRVLSKEGSRHLLPKLQLARVACLIQCYTAMGISNQAQGLIVSACHNQTSSSYESAWRLWGS